MLSKLFWISFIIVDGVDTIYDKRSARFAEFFDEIAEGMPVEKIARLKDFIQSTIVLTIVNFICSLNMKIKTTFDGIFFYISDSCKAEDITSLKQAVSARDCLRYLRDAKLFTSSDVIFVQYLFKRINCNELFVECYKYAEKQDALCFYEKPPGNIILIFFLFLKKIVKLFHIMFFFVCVCVSITYQCFKKPLYFC